MRRFALWDLPHQVPPDPRLFDPDPLTPQPEVTVPQAGTGHFRLRRKLREMLGGEAGYDNVTLLKALKKL